MYFMLMYIVNWFLTMMQKQFSGEKNDINLFINSSETTEYPNAKIIKESQPYHASLKSELKGCLHGSVG